MTRPPLRTLAALVLSAGAGLAAMMLAFGAGADGVEVDAPATIVVGSPQGHAPRDRLDDARRGQSASRLPSAPRELWRRELAGGLEVQPLVDGEGGLIAALVSPDVVRLDDDGRQVWRTRLGVAQAVVAPVLTSDGSTVVLTGDGRLWSVSAGGVIRYELELHMRSKKTLAAPHARDDGGVWVATDEGLLRVSGDGAIEARASLEGRPVGGLIPWRGGILATLTDGTVVHWRPPSQPRKLGDFGGAIDGGGLLASDRTLVAVVEQQRVIGVDLLGGGRTLIAGAGGTGAPLEAPPTLEPSGVLLVSNVVGELFGVDATGTLVRSMALENLPIGLGADGGTGMAALLGRVESRPSPPMIVDPRGRVAFARNSGKVGLVEPGGETVITVSPRMCARPLAVLPAGDQRLLVACHSGSVAMFGSASESPP